MYSSATFWLIIAACLGLGTVAGWFIHRMMDPAERRQREFARKLADTERALAEYRTEVNEHFRGTAERVNRLTEDYRELHQHLSDGAVGLCAGGDTEQPLLTSLAGAAHRGAAPSTSPPLDYAPRRSAMEPGILNEEYDLDSVRSA